MSNNLDDELPDEQPSDDFANFDPAAYVAKHNEEMGRHINIVKIGRQTPQNLHMNLILGKFKDDHDIFDDFLASALHNPPIAAYLPT